LVKQHASVPRHPINGDKYLSPPEVGKARDNIVKAARTASQLFNNCFFYGQYGQSLRVK